MGALQKRLPEHLRSNLIPEVFGACAYSRSFRQPEACLSPERVVSPLLTLQSPAQALNELLQLRILRLQLQCFFRVF